MASNVTGTSGKIHKYLIYLQPFSRFYNKIMILQCTINNSVTKIKVNIFSHSILIKETIIGVEFGVNLSLFHSKKVRIRCLNLKWIINIKIHTGKVQITLKKYLRCSIHVLIELF